MGRVSGPVPRPPGWRSELTNTNHSALEIGCGACHELCGSVRASVPLPFHPGTCNPPEACLFEANPLERIVTSALSIHRI